jgi:hypothetical protein
MSKDHAFAGPTFLYHRTEAPQGRIFHVEDTHPGKGWVDAPFPVEHPQTAGNGPQVAELLLQVSDLTDQVTALTAENDDLKAQIAKTAGSAAA